MDERKIDTVDNEFPNIDQENSGTTKKRKDFLKKFRTKKKITTL